MEKFREPMASMTFSARKGSALKKMFRMVRFTLFCFFLSLIQVMALDSYSQQTRISLNQNGERLEEVLKTIEDKSEFFFLYNKDLINVNQTVNINVTNQTITTILDKLLKETDISYSIVNRQIILSNLEGNSGLVTQQQKKISGKVTDSNGVSLPGVSVVIKGTTTGTITDANGNYSITNILENATLKFSFVGMKTHEIAIGNKATINVTLVEDAIGIEEVVAIGYGTQKKVNLTGSVSSVNFNESLESRPSTTLSLALGGQSSGLYIRQNNSAPGAESSTIRIRGVGTLNNSDPLVMIDGVAGNINDVNPNDVGTISVLKDAASSAIYGSRAANGVILVTTKRGQKDKLSVTYNGYVGVESTAHMLDFISNFPTQMELVNQAKINSGQPALFSKTTIDEWRAKSDSDPLLYPNTDWFREILKPSVIQDHNLTVKGGNAKSSYMLSLGFLDNNGVVKKADYKKYSLRLNTDSQVNDWLLIGSNVFGFWSERGPVDTNNLLTQMAGGTTVGMLPRHPDGRYGGAMAVGDNMQANNPLLSIDAATGNNERQNFGTKVFAKINFLKHFQFESSFAANMDFNKSWGYWGSIPQWNFQTNTIVRAGSARNGISNSASRYYATTIDDILRFNYSINDQHNITALVGYNQEYSRYDGFSASKLDLLNDQVLIIDAAAADPTANGTANDRAIRSFFGRINYDYKGRYLFEANARYDGSSRFASDLRWGFFPSFSAGWRISEENFFDGIKSHVDNVKLRASWGQLGNNSIGDYEYQSLYASQNYSFGGNIVLGSAPTAISNGIITWESTTIADIGLDFSLFKNSLSCTFDYFDKMTNDILVRLPIPLVMGNLTAPNQNAGQVSNKGWDFDAQYQGKIGSDFKYNVGGNISYIKNNVVKYRDKVISYNGATILTEGQPINSFYVREVDHIIQNQSEVDALLAQGYTFAPGIPKPGDFLYKDQNGDKKINDDDRIVKGNSIPKYTYGINLQASYKGIDFAVYGQGVQGLSFYWNDGYNTSDINASGISRTKFLQGWTPENKSTKFPRNTMGIANNTVYNDYWLTNVSYLKIKSVQLGYTLPQSISQKFYMNRLRLYANLENYITFTKYDGFDPENLGGTYPNLKQCIFGINLTF